MMRDETRKVGDQILKGFFSYQGLYVLMRFNCLPGKDFEQRKEWCAFQKTN